MDISQLILIAAAILALVISVAAWQRSGQPLTLQGVQEIATGTMDLATDINQVANVAVASAQQLKESGKIDSNDAAFRHAVEHVEAWYNSVAPDIDLDPQVVANVVESAYFWLRQMKGADDAPKPRNDLDILEQIGRAQQGAGGADAGVV